MHSHVKNRKTRSEVDICMSISMLGAVDQEAPAAAETYLLSDRLATTRTCLRRSQPSQQLVQVLNVQST